MVSARQEVVGKITNTGWTLKRFSFLLCGVDVSVLCCPLLNAVYSVNRLKAHAWT